MRTAALLFFILFGLAASVFSEFAGLLLYVWFALFRPQEFVWGELDAFRLSAVILVVFFGRALLAGVLPDVKGVLSRLALMFLGAALIAQSNAPDSATGWYWIGFLVTLLLASLMAVTLLDSVERYAALVLVMALSFGFHAVRIGFFSAVHGGVEIIAGTGGQFGDRNDFALGASMILPLMLATARTAEPRVVRLFAYAGVPLAIYGVVSTFSRGGFLALMAGLAVYIAVHPRRRVLLPASIVAALLLLPFVSLPEGFQERLATIRMPGEVVDGSARMRLHYWGVALDVAADNPLGVGLMNFPAVYAKYDASGGAFGTMRTVHNSWLQVLTETGVLGLVAFVSAHLYAVMVLIRIRRRAAASGSSDTASFFASHATALLALLAAFIAGGTFASMALNDLTWYAFGLVTALDRLSLRLVVPPAPPSRSQPVGRVQRRWRAQAQLQPARGLP